MRTWFQIDRGQNGGQWQVLKVNSVFLNLKCKYPINIYCLSLCFLFQINQILNFKWNYELVSNFFFKLLNMLQLSAM